MAEPVQVVLQGVVVEEGDGRRRQVATRPPVGSTRLSPHPPPTQGGLGASLTSPHHRRPRQRADRREPQRRERPRRRLDAHLARGDARLERELDEVLRLRPEQLHREVATSDPTWPGTARRATGWHRRAASFATAASMEGPVGRSATVA